MSKVDFLTVVRRYPLDYRLDGHDGLERLRSGPSSARCQRQSGRLDAGRVRTEDLEWRKRHSAPAQVSANGLVSVGDWVKAIIADQQFVIAPLAQSIPQ